MGTDYRRVLVAVDFSPASRALVAAAGAIAPGARLEAGEKSTATSTRR